MLAQRLLTSMYTPTLYTLTHIKSTGSTVRVRGPNANAGSTAQRKHAGINADPPAQACWGRLDKAPPRAKKRLETGARAAAVTVRQKRRTLQINTIFGPQRIAGRHEDPLYKNITHIENAAAKGEQRQSSVASRISALNAPPLYAHQHTNKHTHTHTRACVCSSATVCILYLLHATHTHTRIHGPVGGSGVGAGEPELFFFPASAARRVRSGRLRSAPAQRVAGCFLFCVSLLLCAKARAPQTRLLLQSDNTSGDV